VKKVGRGGGIVINNGLVSIALNMVKKMEDTNQNQRIGVPDENGSFLLSATCRCSECDAVSITSITMKLERVRIDDNLIGLIDGSGVAMIVKYINLMDGWSLGKDLKPRCSKHSNENNKNEQ
jgi:hypothetical protein